MGFGGFDRFPPPRRESRLIWATTTDTLSIDC
ncbi:unnamed protein product [Onchocerca flexuosa]|uniref:Uncharacterized protein n=1 Tax=Onchocerca flexuosa TaxID=387005 RepID=A0A183HUY1_9BILA|nr:unnamed protein product [Onchocerca flexuosa]